MNICYNTSLERNDLNHFKEQFLNLSYNNNTIYDDRYSEEYFENSGIIISATFIVIFVLNLEVFKQKKAEPTIFKKNNSLTNYLLAKILSLLCLSISIIISPIIFTIFLICFIYRSTVKIILKYQYPNEFIDLLEGTDTFWAIEDISKSIINILVIIESNDINKFKKEITLKLTEIIQNKKFHKLQYFREKKYGYYYWSKKDININEHITDLPEIEDGKKCINQKELVNILAEKSNTLFPKNHASSWEILVGKQSLENEISVIKTYPILFRFHHSIGDGLALIKILLEAADTPVEENNGMTIKTKQISVLKQVKIKLASFIQTLLSIVFVPGHLIHMNLVQQIDNNTLHGNTLSGSKILTWISEDDNYPILKIIKQIKSRFLNVSFLDVVLAVLSESFYNYFEQNTNETPESVTAVVLERAERICLAEYMSAQNCFANCQLQNRFTVGMLHLPILPRERTEIGNNLQTFQRLQDVNRESYLLKNASPDYQINYWLLKDVSELLPEPILRPMLHSAHSTMVVSNILGPKEVTICNGHLIKDIIFWLPHRGLTGIGVSILSYADKLKIGIMVDRALICSSDDADIILQNFMKCLKRLDETTQNK